MAVASPAGEWALDEFIEGHHLPRGMLGAEAARDLGRTLRVLHRIPVRGYGSPIVTESGALEGQSGDVLSGIDARFDAPLSAERKELRAHPLIAAAPEMEDHLARVIRRIRRELEDQRVAICHTDLHERQLVIQGTRLAALLDFGEAAIGDPRWDLGSVFYFQGLRILEAAVRGYTRRNEERRDLIAGARLFSVAIAMHHASRSRLPGKEHRLAYALAYVRDTLGTLPTWN